MALTTWIRLVATEEDRQLIEEIAREDGDSSMSAAVRRLIRQEARRRNLSGNAHPLPVPEQVAEWA